MNFRKRIKYWLYNSCPGFAGSFPYYGTRVHFQPGAYLFRQLCVNGVFEQDIINRFVSSSRPGTTLFDVGANIGLMAIPILQACPTCRMVSFEPSPNSLPFLQRTASESIYRDRWTVVGKGLSCQSGELDFVAGNPEEDVFEGFKSGTRITRPQMVKVPVSTLDEEWMRLDKPEVSTVKIDVEGAEGFVLQGGDALLHACHPNLVVEWHEPYLKEFGTPVEMLLSLAVKYGYRIYTIPHGVPVDDVRTLRVQMMGCSNFLLLV